MIMDILYRYHFNSCIIEEHTMYFVYNLRVAGRMATSVGAVTVLKNLQVEYQTNPLN